MGASTTDLRKFKQMMLSEKTLEDSIEANFPGFANFVQRSLQFIGRQYETTVGPIDILARDKKTGGYVRSEENTSELQSLMRISYAVFCLKKKHTITQKITSIDR